MSGMNINQILEYLPHRYPFLMVDRVLSCERSSRHGAILVERTRLGNAQPRAASLPLRVLA